MLFLKAQSHFIIAQCLSYASYASSYTGLDYDYMTAWGNAMCANQDKSPINIDTLTAIKDNTICAPQFELNIDSTKQTFRISNNGYTLSLVTNTLCTYTQSQITQTSSSQYRNQLKAKSRHRMRPHTSLSHPVATQCLHSQIIFNQHHLNTTHTA